LIRVQAFKSFPEADLNSSKSQQPEHLDEIFTALVTESRIEQEVSPLALIGWYSVRARDGLDQSDIVFHDRHFRRFTDVALILRSEEQAGVLLQTYARSTEGLLTEQQHRRGAVRLAAGLQAAEPVDVTMSAKSPDELLKANDALRYRGVYEASKSLRQAEPQAQGKGIVQGAKRIASSVFWPKRSKPERIDSTERRRAENTQLIPSIHSRSTDSVAPRLDQESAASLRRMESPAKNSDAPSVPEKKERRTPSWTAVVAITAGVILAVLISGALAGKETYQFFHSIFLNKGLGLQTESKGDSILLGWNRRNSIVRSATGGVLQIDDGIQHHRIRLDQDQVASGSVLYVPATDDVTFRLELYGKGGDAIKGSMRVLNDHGHQRSSVEPSASNLAVDVTAGPVVESSLRPEVRNRTERDIKQNLARLAERKSRSAPENSDGAIAAIPPGSVPSPALGASAINLENTSTTPVPLKKTPELSWIPSSNVPRQDFVRQLALASQTASWDDAVQKPALHVVKPVEMGNAKTLSHPSPVEAGLNSAQTRPTTLPAGSTAPAFAPPHPLRQVVPNQIPRIITSALDVEVEVKLDRNGHVETARLLKQAADVPLYLTGAALTAAKQWTFRPATLGGIPVESNFTIVFRIRPTGR
jgi:hypothetical protein